MKAQEVGTEKLEAGGEERQTLIRAVPGSRISSKSTHPPAYYHPFWGLALEALGFRLRNFITTLQFHWEAYSASSTGKGWNSETGKCDLVQSRVRREETGFLTTVRTTMKEVGERSRKMFRGTVRV